MQVLLVIRGICRIRPGVPGVSDNIRVVSIIGRGLHSSTIRLNVRAFRGIGSPLRGCLGCIRGYYGWFRVY